MDGHKNNNNQLLLLLLEDFCDTIRARNTLFRAAARERAWLGLTRRSMIYGQSFSFLNYVPKINRFFVCFSAVGAG
jgi:hypothetical protein